MVKEHSVEAHGLVWMNFGPTLQQLRDKTPGSGKGDGKVGVDVSRMCSQPGPLYAFVKLGERVHSAPGKECGRYRDRGFHHRERELAPRACFSVLVLPRRVIPRKRVVKVFCSNAPCMLREGRIRLAGLPMCRL